MFGFAVGPAQSAGIIPADGDFPLDLLEICCTPVHDSYAANACVHSAGIRQGISFFFFFFQLRDRTWIMCCCQALSAWSA
jgi:hypothetical protein